jgi:hypothetical protein
MTRNSQTMMKTIIVVTFETVLHTVLAHNMYRSQLIGCYYMNRSAAEITLI